MDIGLVSKICINT